MPWHKQQGIAHHPVRRTADDPCHQGGEGSADLPAGKQVATVENLKAAYAEESRKALHDLQQAAIKNRNMFEVLMEACKYCSLGQLTEAMFEVGGRYRRNL